MGGLMPVRGARLHPEPRAPEPIRSRLRAGDGVCAPTSPPLREFAGEGVQTKLLYAGLGPNRWVRGSSREGALFPVGQGLQRVHVGSGNGRAGITTLSKNVRLVRYFIDIKRAADHHVMWASRFLFRCRIWYLSFEFSSSSWRSQRARVGERGRESYRTTILRRECLELDLPSTPGSQDRPASLRCSGS